MKKRILGLAVIIGVILALSTSAFAATTSVYTPKFTTSKLADAEAGKTYTQDIVVEVKSSDATWTIEIVSPTVTQLKTSYDLTMYNGSTADATSMSVNSGTLKGTYTLKNVANGVIFRDTSGLKLTFKATNGGQSVTKEYTLKIKGTAPEFTSPTDDDLGKTAAFTNAANSAWNKRGVGVVGRAFQAATANPITIQAGKGTLPIKMSATGLVDGLSTVQTYGSTDANVTTAAGATSHTTATQIPQMYILGTPKKAGKMSVTAKAENATKSVTKKYTLTILDSPDITTTKLGDATYGKAYSATLAAKGGDKNYPLAWYATNLPTGLKLTSKDGKISGTLSKDAIVFKHASKDATYNVKFRAISYADGAYPASATTGTVYDEVTLPLKVKAVKPVFISADTFKSKTLVLSASQTLQASLAKAVNKDFASVVNANNMLIYVDTAAKFSVKGLPAGWTVTTGQVVSTDTATAANLKLGRGSYVTLTGAGLKATTPVKSGKIEITATNGAGSAKLSIPYKVDAAKPIMVAKAAGTAIADTTTATDVSYLNGTTGVIQGTGSTAPKAKALETKIDAILRAMPGPIKWKGEKLPKGLTLKASGDEYATLKGTLNKEQDATQWKITATNSVTNDSITISGDVAVYTSPDIKTTKLSKATAGRHYTGKVDVKGTGAAFVAAKLTNSTGTDIYGPSKKNTAVTLNNVTYGKIAFLSDDKGKCYISADFTRIPPGGQIRVYMKAQNAAGMYDETLLSLDVSGTAPKIKTAKIFDDNNGSKLTTAITTAVNASIDITGTDPIRYRAYVDSKDAVKLGLTKSGWLLFTNGNANYAGGNTANTNGYKFVSKDTDDGMTVTVTALPDMAAKGLPITIEATNDAANGKWTKKTFKVDVTGQGVDWKYGKAANYSQTAVTAGTTPLPKASKDITVYAVAGKKNDAFVILTMSGDKPWQVTTKPVSGDTDAKKGNVNGISVKGTGSTVTIYGTPTAGKETKTKIPVTLTNPTTKAKRAVNVSIVAQVPPVLKSSDKNNVSKVLESKDFEVGKKVTISLSTKAGSKQGMKWGIKSVSGVDGVTTEALLKSKLGLELDSAKGKITGTPIATTSASKAFKYAIITVSASNAAGTSDTGVVYLGVKGKKFSIDTRNSKLSLYNNGSNNVGQIVTNINNEKASKDIKFATEGTVPTGVTLAEDGKITIASGTAASKGETLKFTANNVGTVVKGQVKVVINDPAPTVTLGTAPQTLTASSNDKVTGTSTATAANVTGDTTIKWSVKNQPSDSKVRVAVKADTKDKTGATATVTVTVPKNYTGKISSEKIKIIATNSITKEVGSADITLSVNTSSNSALPENNEALPEEELAEESEETPEEEAEETNEVEAEAGVTLGAARTAADLTAGQIAAIEKEGYIIAAVLPEMTVAASGQYDLEVELSENAPEGAKLVWFAFPKGVEASTDDEIAEFFDETGADIEAVPASRKIVVSPWLDAEVTYAPVIVVKADDAEGAKDSLDDAQAGDVVTEEALVKAE